MTEVVRPGSVQGCIAAIPSKSHAHRLLIGGMLADGPVRIRITASSRDIEATLGCIQALGTQVKVQGEWRILTPGPVPPQTQLNCGESGSTLRFLLPVAAALGCTTTLSGTGRLPERPLSPLLEELEAHGVTFSEKQLPLTVSGTLNGGRYRLPGSISSQYFTGLLLALPLLEEDSLLEIDGVLESARYLDITLQTLESFGISIERESGRFRIPGRQQYHSPGTIIPEGDWSNAAFFLAAGALRGPVTVTGLQMDSPQGDRAIIEVLESFGAKITVGDHAVTVAPGPLRAITLDASQIPDLVPVLSVVAALAEGTTCITGAARLRLKESDRLKTTTALLRALGICASETPDGLEIQGGTLQSGTVDGAGDHRIVMAAAVAALAATGPVTIQGAEAVEKSYPGFFMDLMTLAGGENR